MSTTSERVPFVEARFLEDIRKGSEDMGAPYDEAVVKSIIEAYGDIFYEGAIQLRGSNRDGVPLLWRVLMATPVDTVEVALKNGWLAQDDPMIPVVRGIKEAFPQAYEQPEFTADRGLDGSTIILGKLASLDEVFSIPGLPETVLRHRQTFADNNLSVIQTVACNYATHQVSMLAIAQGPLTKRQIDDLAALAGAPPSEEAVYRGLAGVLLDSPFYLSLGIDTRTGDIARVEFHLLFPITLPDEMEIPDVGSRLERFWDVPSYECEDMDILSWIFGDDSLGSILALRSYCGGVRGQLRAWSIMGV